MADVSINYKGVAISEMSESGTKTLNTSGTYCEGDISVIYTKQLNRKSYKITHPTAVAAQDVTVVYGDADVAAHYADEDAKVIIRKASNKNTNGVVFLFNSNKTFGGAGNIYGFYGNYNASSSIVNAASFYPNQKLSSSLVSNGIPSVRCNSRGDIIVYAHRTQNNFGGADYEIEFMW